MLISRVTVLLSLVLIYPALIFADVNNLPKCRTALTNPDLQQELRDNPNHAVYCSHNSQRWVIFTDITHKRDIYNCNVGVNMIRTGDLYRFKTGKNLHSKYASTIAISLETLPSFEEAVETRSFSPRCQRLVNEISCHLKNPAVHSPNLLCVYKSSNV